MTWGGWWWKLGHNWPPSARVHPIVSSVWRSYVATLCGPPSVVQRFVLRIGISLTSNLRIVRLSSSCVMSVICRKMALQIVESCNPGLENMEKVWRIWRTWKRGKTSTRWVKTLHDSKHSICRPDDWKHFFSAFIATVENHKILAWRTSWVSSRLAKIKRNVEPYDYIGLHLWDFFWHRIDI